MEDVATDQQMGGLAVSLIIDRATASRLGVAPTTIDQTLYDAFGQRQINTMYTQLNQYHVILEAEPQFQLDPNKLDHLYIRAGSAAGTNGAPAASTSNGSTSAGTNALTGSPLFTPSANTFIPPVNALRSSTANVAGGAGSAGTPSSMTNGAVPLSAFSHFETTTQPLSITHQGQFPAITVSFNLAPNAALGGAISDITKIQQDMHMPASLQADFQGTAASFRNSLSNMPLLILAALVTVYIVLGVLYESFIHPITILSTLPSAGVGAFLSLILFHQDLSVVAIIGLVLLIGIVKKNGIMMVDFALDAERHQGAGGNGGDLPSLPAAIPADYDDDNGGAARRNSAGVWPRHRVRTAETPGNRDGRRSAAEPDSYAVYDAGDLHFLRQYCDTVFEKKA